MLALLDLGNLERRTATAPDRFIQSSFVTERLHVQVKRWWRQYVDSTPVCGKGMEELKTWLSANIPGSDMAPSKPTIAHGATFKTSKSLNEIIR